MGRGKISNPFCQVSASAAVVGRKLPGFAPFTTVDGQKLPSFAPFTTVDGQKLPSFAPFIPSFGLSAYRFPLMASTMFIREARQAGMPALSRFISRQKRKAARKIQGLSKAPAVRLVSPAR